MKVSRASVSQNCPAVRLYQPSHTRTCRVTIHLYTKRYVRTLTIYNFTQLTLISLESVEFHCGFRYSEGVWQVSFMYLLTICRKLTDSTDISGYPYGDDNFEPLALTKPSQSLLKHPDPMKTTHCNSPYSTMSLLVQYALMIDGGSTGSRIHIYKFNNCGGP